jgi:hypothetical protein
MIRINIPLTNHLDMWKTYYIRCQLLMWHYYYWPLRLEVFELLPELGLCIVIAPLHSHIIHINFNFKLLYKHNTFFEIDVAETTTYGSSLIHTSNLRATLSLQIWTWEEISSTNPLVLQECVIRYTISHMFQEILALEILSKPTLLGSRRNSTRKRLNLLCWKNYVATLSEMHTTLTADIASLLTSWTKLKASLDKIKRKWCYRT